MMNSTLRLGGFCITSLLMPTPLASGAAMADFGTSLLDQNYTSALALHGWSNPALLKRKR